jgi:hypothetical protein
MTHTVEIVCQRDRKQVKLVPPKPIYVDIPFRARSTTYYNHLFPVLSQLGMPKEEAAKWIEDYKIEISMTKDTVLVTMSSCPSEFKKFKVRSLDKGTVSVLAGIEEENKKEPPSARSRIIRGLAFGLAGSAAYLGLVFGTQLHARWALKVQILYAQINILMQDPRVISVTLQLDQPTLIPPDSLLLKATDTFAALKVKAGVSIGEQIRRIGAGYTEKFDIELRFTFVSQIQVMIVLSTQDGTFKSNLKNITGLAESCVAYFNAEMLVVCTDQDGPLNLTTPLPSRWKETNEKHRFLFNEEAMYTKCFICQTTCKEPDWNKIEFVRLVPTVSETKEAGQSFAQELKALHTAEDTLLKSVPPTSATKEDYLIKDNKVLKLALSMMPQTPHNAPSWLFTDYFKVRGLPPKNKLCNPLRLAFHPDKFQTIQSHEVQGLLGPHFELLNRFCARMPQSEKTLGESDIQDVVTRINLIKEALLK